jgi:prevent-host-death family protein
MNRVGLKELRQNVAKYAKKVKSGHSFVVMKHSRPLFKISPLEDDARWEEVIDFTKIKKGGIDIDDLLARL